MQHRPHDLPGTRGTEKQLLVAFLLNTFFVFIEIAGGVLTNSVAILSDALHDLGDSLALGMAWYFERLGRRDRTARYTYGFRRYSVLGAVINAIVLILGSAFIIREAVIRIQDPEPVHGTGMLVLALLGVTINGIAFARLHRSHSHNVEVVRLHLLEDVFGWIVVFLGAIAIQIWSVYILDPLLSILVALWILYHVVRRLSRSIGIMLQVTPTGFDTDEIIKTLLAVPGVQAVHDMHLWTMDGQFHIVTAHVVVDPDHTLRQLSAVKGQIRAALQSMGIRHATIEFEYAGEDCLYDDLNPQ